MYQDQIPHTVGRAGRVMKYKNLPVKHAACFISISYLSGGKTPRFDVFYGKNVRVYIRAVSAPASTAGANY